MREPRHNMGASVRGRLLNIARERQQPFASISRALNLDRSFCRFRRPRPPSGRRFHLRRPSSRRLRRRQARRRISPSGQEGPQMVELRCGAVSVGRTYLFPPLSSGGALVVRPWLRFHIPLIEPDRRLSRIRLSDKTSRLRPRHVAPERGQAYEPEVPVKVREWISPALASPDLVLDAQRRNRTAV